MGLLDKVKDKLSKPGSTSSGPDISLPPPPTRLPLEQSLYRYRKQYGVNLGSWFALERWITPGVFQNAKSPGQSDYDVAHGANARQVLEAHWDSWVTEGDWQWIKSKGFNSVRIPIGYYHLSGACPEILIGTDFESVAEVYQGAWDRIVKAIKDAERHGLGVLTCMEPPVPKTLTATHSGLSNGKVNMWTSFNLVSTSIALRFLASSLSPYPNVVGLELLNEPQNNGRLQGWYEDTLRSCRTVAGPDFPLYISDAWDTQWYARWVGGRVDSADFVVLDHHLYRCFTDADRALSGDQHAQRLRGEFASTLSGQSGDAKGCIVVGEWSASLDSRSFPPGVNDTERDRHRRVFVQAQMEVMGKCTAGWWFWTFKKGEGWDAGWSAQNAAQAEILPPWVGSSPMACSPPPQARDHAMKQAHGYWSSRGGTPDASVFPLGFQQGWADALLFFSADRASASEMGFVKPWCRRRRDEFESGTGTGHTEGAGKGRKLGKAAWEWEHGFEQGVEACRAACL